MYIPTMGLEIHAELNINSKIFCGCGAQFGGDQNTRVCAGCSAVPGTLPLLNKKAVEYTIKAGFTMGCSISQFTKWDRKNYFYPDLPKSYQVSQLARPLCIGGKVTIEADGQTKDIRINRIHLEEDAGKLVHDDYENVSLADYNRGSRALIEIVTEPDFHSANEVKAFVEQIILLLQYAEVCECKLEQGTMRCDVNISLAKENADKLGTRAEIKNLNSLKSIVKAIEYEIKRQSQLLDSGKEVHQETRRFNDAKNETKALRSKEDAHDYRYFPDPDIPPLVITDEELSAIRASLAEMPNSRKNRYVNSYGLSETDAMIIITDKRVCDFYEQSIKTYNNPKALANFIIVELLRRINLGEADMETLKFGAKEFAKLTEMAETDKISKSNAKIILRSMVETGESPKEIADKNDFWIKEDNELLEKTINDILAANPTAVEQYKNGEQKVFGFLMGLCNKQLKGACNPKAIKDTLEMKLK